MPHEEYCHVCKTQKVFGLCRCPDNGNHGKFVEFANVMQGLQQQQSANETTSHSLKSASAQQQK